MGKLFIPKKNLERKIDELKTAHIDEDIDFEEKAILFTITGTKNIWLWEPDRPPRVLGDTTPEILGFDSLNCTPNKIMMIRDNEILKKGLYYSWEDKMYSFTKKDYKESMFKEITMLKEIKDRVYVSVGGMIKENHRPIYIINNGAYITDIMEVKGELYHLETDTSGSSKIITTHDGKDFVKEEDWIEGMTYLNKTTYYGGFGGKIKSDKGLNQKTNLRSIRSMVTLKDKIVIAGRSHSGILEARTYDPKTDKEESLFQAPYYSETAFIDNMITISLEEIEYLFRYI